jgi:hypothetical protein
MYIRRSKITALMTSAVLSLMMLATRMERVMADSTVMRRVLQVEHITIKNGKKIRGG